MTSGNDGRGFQLTFTAATTSSSDQDDAARGYLDPIVTRVIIAVTFNGLPQVF